MLDAIRAEARKLWGHRRATWSLLGAIPLLLIVLFVCVELYHALNGGPRSVMRADGMPPQLWAAQSLQMWQVPQNLMWLFAAAFSAIAFGGEYRWNTLKLIAPHRDRLQIIAAKFIVVVIFLAVSLFCFGVLALFFAVLHDVFAGRGVPAGVDWGAVFWRHLLVWSQAVLAVSLVAAYAALAATAMRSTAGGIVVAVIAFIVFALPPQLWQLVSANAWRFSPGYALSNLQNWAGAGRALSVPIPGAPIEDGWLLSLGVAGAWLLALIALTTLIFGRQDFN